MDKKKLEELSVTPRINLDLVAKAYSRPMLGFLRKAAVAEWEKSAANAPLVVMGVVQAANHLYERGEDTYGYAAVVFSTDEKKALDEKWVKDLANKVAEVREMESPKGELAEVHSVLNDTESMFDTLELPSSLTGGVKAYLSHQGLDRVENVEGGKLHEDSVLVGFYVNDNGFQHYTPLLPAELYK